jgi:hypothetical protein
VHILLNLVKIVKDYSATTSFQGVALSADR